MTDPNMGEPNRVSDYPSGDEDRDAVIELLCDEWPTECIYLEWNKRRDIVVRLLDVLDRNQLAVIEPVTP